MGRVAAIDLAGRTFGELVVVERGPGLRRRAGGTEAQWLCACACGAERLVRAGRLLTGAATTCGAHRTARTPDSTYTAVHKRLRRLRGPASHHLCETCGRQADQWALASTDGPDVHTAPGGYAFSTDLDRYEPMCRTCHELHDALERRRRDRAAVAAAAPGTAGPCRPENHLPPPLPTGKVLTGTLF